MAAGPAALGRRLSGASLQKVLEKNAIEIIPGELYFVSAPSPPPLSTEKQLIICTDAELHYEPFHKDFGPLNMAMLYRYCTRLSMLLKARQHEGKPIYHWTSSGARDAAARTNAAYLISAYAVVILGLTPEEAYTPLASLEHTFVGFRDASYNATCAYRLPIIECLNGLVQGMLHGWLDLGSFNMEEYEYYERVENGDLNWVLPGKFIAFAGPHNEHKWDNGYPLLAPEDYFDYFSEGGVTDVIRLNNPLYEKSRFTDAGFVHHDLFFVDGSIPPEPIVEQFLRIAESARGGIAIHCKAGLGRTGTLIALYMMKHYMLTAAECIAWLRVSRPGSVLGPQQFYLQDKQEEMWSEGAKIGVVRKTLSGIADAAAAISDMDLGGAAGAAPGAAGHVPGEYAAPETTAPEGVQQGDYLNAQKSRRQGGGK
mmetsp:Transcript_23141/g.60472  ORF Transcript_23141/g.60472 Transcript_23141/m.60472 type:complete len:426 (+) Transcript_23141:282-1559(+)